jgi:polynucleotide 5'-hydroxyl-kinase GRC3/NOL9
MAQKRKAFEAFGGSTNANGHTNPDGESMTSKGRLSAFAAAKLARQSLPSTPEPPQTLGALDSILHAISEDVEDDAVEVDASTIASYQPTSTTAPLRLSTCDHANVNSSSDCLELTLHTDQTATIVGQYNLAVISGIVTIYGAVLRANSATQGVYAPSTHALPQIHARQNATIIRISSIRSGLRKLEKLSPLFRNIWASDSLEGHSFKLLGTSADDALQRSLTCLEIDRETDVVLRTLSAKTLDEPQQLRIVAIGGKSSGKSTFNRILWNHLRSWTSTTKCQFLDIDPGQPEFGPPGTISLVEVHCPILGPPYTHFASRESTRFRLVRTHTIAATSFKEDDDHYKQCVRDLMQHVRPQDLLLVNSCGWLTGVGMNVLLQLIEDLSISDVVLMEPLDGGFVEHLQHQRRRLAVHRVPRRPPRSAVRTPAESRAMQMMSYFHHQLDAGKDFDRWTGKAISRMRHWTADYSGDEPAIAAVMSYGQTLKPEFLVEVLEGSLVAINVLEQGEATRLLGTVGTTPEELPFVQPDQDDIYHTLDPKHSRCIGLALVRAIDVTKKQFHLVTPLPESQVASLAEKTVVLVRGSFDAPEWAYLEDLYKDENPEDQIEQPWVSRKSLVGVEGAVWRLRHPPMANAVAKT